MKPREEVMKARRRSKQLFKLIKKLTISVLAIIGMMFCLNSFAQGSNELKFVHISDTHFSLERENTPYKLIKESPKLLDDAIHQINFIPALDFVMFGGDMVDRAKESELIGFLEKAKEINAPWYVTFGNHDWMLGGYLTIDRYIAHLKKYNKNFNYGTNYSFSPKKGYKVIVVDSIIRDRLTSNGRVSKENIAWLDAELKKVKNEIVLIFTHIPFLEPIAIDNHRLLNSQEVLNVLAKYKFPMAVFQGHYHVAKIEQKNNVLFVTTPSMVSYPNAFREIKVVNENDKVVFNINTRNTTLSNLRTQAKLFLIAPSIAEGEDSDKNGIFTIEK